MTFSSIDRIRSRLPILAAHLDEYTTELYKRAMEGYLILLEVTWDGVPQYAVGTSCFDGVTTDPMKAKNFGKDAIEASGDFSTLWDTMFAIYRPDLGGAKSGVRSTDDGRVVVFEPPRTRQAFRLTHFQNAPAPKANVLFGLEGGPLDS